MFVENVFFLIIKVYEFKISMHTNYNIYQKRQRLAYSLLKVFFNVLKSREPPPLLAMFCLVLLPLIEENSQELPYN